MNTWYYQQGEQAVGPFDWEILVRLKVASVIDDVTPVKNSDGGNWYPLAEAMNQKIASTENSIPPNPARYYYLDVNRQPVGPFDLNSVRSLFAGQVITESTFVTGTGDAQWIPVSQLLGIPENQQPPISTGANSDAKTSEPMRRTFGRLALMLGLTLGFYVLYLVPSYSRDMKAITEKPRMEFQPLLVLCIVSFALALLVSQISDDALTVKFFNFAGGLPVDVMLVLWAFDLEKHGKTLKTVNRQESLGAYLLVLTIIGSVIGLMSGGLAIVVGMAIGGFAVWLLQKEINLYALPLP
jgi:hypothetical protein